MTLEEKVRVGIWAVLIFSGLVLAIYTETLLLIIAMVLIAILGFTVAIILVYILMWLFGQISIQELKDHWYD